MVPGSDLMLAGSLMGPGGQATPLLSGGGPGMRSMPITGQGSGLLGGQHPSGMAAQFGQPQGLDTRGW